MTTVQSLDIDHQVVPGCTLHTDWCTSTDCHWPTVDTDGWTTLTPDWPIGWTSTTSQWSSFCNAISLDDKRSYVWTHMVFSWWSECFFIYFV